MRRGLRLALLLACAAASCTQQEPTKEARAPADTTTAPLPSAAAQPPPLAPSADHPLPVMAAAELLFSSAAPLLDTAIAGTLALPPPAHSQEIAIIIGADLGALTLPLITKVLGHHRAQLERWQHTASPLFTLRLDGGNNLSPSPPHFQPSAAHRERAEHVLAALSQLGIDTMLVGLRDLVLPVEVLGELAAQQGVTLLSTNLLHLHSGQAAFTPYRIFHHEQAEHGPLRVGLLGLTPGHPTDPRFLRNAGLRLDDAAEALRRGNAALRSADVHACILLSGLGLHATREVIKRLAPADRPNLVLVVGSGHLTPEPLWLDGVILIEAAGGGERLLVVNLPTHFARDRLVNVDLEGLTPVRHLVHQIAEVWHHGAVAGSTRTNRPQMRSLANLLRQRKWQDLLLSGVPPGLSIQVMDSR